MYAIKLYIITYYYVNVLFFFYCIEKFLIIVNITFIYITKKSLSNILLTEQGVLEAELSYSHFYFIQVYAVACSMWHSILCFHGNLNFLDKTNRQLIYHYRLRLSLWQKNIKILIKKSFTWHRQKVITTKKTSKRGKPKYLLHHFLIFHIDNIFMTTFQSLSSRQL